MKIRIRIAFIRSKAPLPVESRIRNPTMKYEVMSGAFIWEDEGLWTLKNHHLQDAFKYVIVHRMRLLVGDDEDYGVMQSKSFDKSIFEMAKKYFPNWIGFAESRCSYSSEIADRIRRIKKVEKWKIHKLLNEK
ncbi:MAG: hypothetical protein AB8B72_02075 [Crocinitomicaceae bacterium]